MFKPEVDKRYNYLVHSHNGSTVNEKTATIGHSLVMRHSFQVEFLWDYMKLLLGIH